VNERNFWLSSLKKRELIELFLFLQKEKIIYCDELNSDLSFRFGLELEFMKGNLEWIKERLREKFLIREGSRYHQWQLKVDTSIPNNKEYILENIIIVTASGKKISITNNSFHMPNEDLKIEFITRKKEESNYVYIHLYFTF